MPKPRETPAFLFYPDDFSSDGKVEAMTTEEVGAYILLLCKAWREKPVGSIPDDDTVLARWTRLTLARWSECKPRVLAPFTLGTDSRWHQARMRKEYNALMNSRQRRLKAAIQGALARWPKGGQNANRMPIASDSDVVPIGNGDGILSGPGEGEPEGEPLPPPTRFLPASEREAVDIGQFVGAPPEFALEVYNQLEGRGWLDGAGIPVTHFGKHLASRWSKQRHEWGKPKGKRKSQPI